MLDHVLNNRTAKKERVFHESIKCTPTNKTLLILSQDIGVADLKISKPRYLSAEKSPIILESMTSDPVIRIAVEPKTKADVDKPRNVWPNSPKKILPSR